MWRTIVVYISWRFLLLQDVLLRHRNSIFNLFKTYGSLVVSYLFSVGWGNLKRGWFFVKISSDIKRKIIPKWEHDVLYAFSSLP